jgi:hypothetical protein
MLERSFVPSISSTTPTIDADLINIAAGLNPVPTLMCGDQFRPSLSHYLFE